MKNINLFNYSKFVFLKTPDAGGSKEKKGRTGSDKQEDLVVKRGAISDFIKQRVEQIVDDENFDVLAKEITGLKEKVAELESKNQALEAKDAELEGRLNGHDQKITDLEAKDTALEGRLNGHDQKITDLEAKDTALEGQITTERERITELEGKNRALESELAAAKGEIAEMRIENANFKQLLKELEERIDRQGLMGLEAVPRKEFDTKIGELTAKDSELDSKIEAEKKRIKSLEDKDTVDPTAFEAVRGRVETLENREVVDPAGFRALEGRVDTVEKKDTVSHAELQAVEGRINTLEEKKIVTPEEADEMKKRIKSLEEKETVDPAAFEAVRGRVETLENREVVDPAGFRALEGRVDAVEKKDTVSHAELQAVGERINTLEQKKVVTPEEADEMKKRIKSLEEKPSFTPDEIDSLNKRITGLESREIVEPVEFEVLNGRVTKIVETVGTLKNVDIKALKDAIKEMCENIDNLANDNTDLHKKITPLLGIPHKLEELERTIRTLSVSPQTIKELLTAIERLKDRIARLENQNTPPPTPPPTPPEDVITEGPEKILGTPPEKMAERIYQTLKDKKHPGWKFSASYHHAKCWKYYKVRPGTEAKTDAERSKTNPEYCAYDPSKDQYLFTEKWFNFIVEKLQNAEEYEKIMKYKPTE